MTYRAKTEAERIFRGRVTASARGNRRRKRTVWGNLDCPLLCRCHNPRRRILDRIHEQEMRNYSEC